MKSLVEYGVGAPAIAIWWQEARNRYSVVAVDDMDKGALVVGLMSYSQACVLQNESIRLFGESLALKLRGTP